MGRSGHRGNSEGMEFGRYRTRNVFILAAVGATLAFSCGDDESNPAILGVTDSGPDAPGAGAGGRGSGGSGPGGSGGGQGSAGTAGIDGGGAAGAGGGGSGGIDASDEGAGGSTAGDSSAGDSSTGSGGAPDGSVTDGGTEADTGPTDTCPAVCLTCEAGVHGYPEPIVLATGSEMWGVALDATHVYFTTAVATGSVGRVPIGGGTVETIAASQTFPNDLAVGAGQVFWSTTENAPNGRIFRAPVTGGARQELANGVQARPAFLDSDGTNLYYMTNFNVVMTVPVGGGTATIRTEGPFYSNVVDMVLAGGSLHVTNNGVWAAPTRALKEPETAFVAFVQTSGTPRREELVSRLDFPIFQVAADATWVFWTDDKYIYRASANGSGASRFVTLQTDVVAASPIQDMVSDGERLYFADAGAIYRVPVGGGTPVPVAWGYRSIWGLRVDAQNLYFTDRVGGALMQTPKCSGGRLPDNPDGGDDGGPGTDGAAGAGGSSGADGGCVGAACGPPRSCEGLATSCGPSANENCCASLPVSGGTFNRGNDATYPATVSSFRLDRFENHCGSLSKVRGSVPGQQTDPRLRQDQRSARRGLEQRLGFAAPGRCHRTLRCRRVFPRGARLDRRCRVQRDATDELHQLVRSASLLYLGRWEAADRGGVELRRGGRQRAARLPVVRPAEQHDR